MSAPTALLHAWLALLLLERLAELALSRRNVRAGLAAGGWEAGRDHDPLLVLFHASFLAACFAEPVLWPRPRPLAVSLAALGGALLAQALRWWAVASLGARWSTRVVVVPGLPLVRRGPYRWLRHPNYLTVAVEDRFHVALSDEEAARASTLADLSRLVCARGGTARLAAPREAP